MKRTFLCCASGFVHTSHTSRSAWELRELCNRHEVVYRVLPERVVHDDDIMKVGFVVEVRGHHDHPPHPVHPGCLHCRHLYDLMTEIVQRARPPQKHLTRFRIDMFQPRLYVEKEDGRYAVGVTIHIVHRGEMFSPVDECEVECLTRFRQGLESLGVHHSY